MPTDTERNTNEEIKARLPVEQVVGSYVPLKKAGRIYKGLCPFHGEKTPSFTVSPDRGVYKCFGCGKGGDIFDFVMEIEGLTFPESVKLLADKAGVEIPEWKPSGRPGTSQSGPSRVRLFETNAYVAKLWNTILTRHPKAEGARHYLEGRGLNAQTIADFQIGYAPYGGGTGTALRTAGYTTAELQAVGDPTKFQDRITFPICDLTGKVVGFTGRLLELKDDPRSAASRGPKYWNTPETAVFVKSRTLYALHLAKHAIGKEGFAILAEGQMDVAMLHQHGYTHTVASSGTALTQEQLKLIARFAPSVAFAYDGDSAGIEATKRGVELALQQELTPYVISIPNGKDPADCLKNDPEAWKAAYDGRVRALDWIIDTALDSVARPIPPEKKKALAHDLVKWLHFVQDPTEQSDWFMRLAAKLQTNEQNLRELYRRAFPKDHESAGTVETPQAPAAHTASKHSLGDVVIAILLTFPETYHPLKPQLGALELVPKSPFFARLLPIIRATPEGTAVDTHVGAHLTDDERKDLALQTEEILVEYGDIELSPSWAITELSLILQRIRTQSRDQAKSRISEEIQRAQQLGDADKIKSLFQELQNLLY